MDTLHLTQSLLKGIPNADIFSGAEEITVCICTLQRPELLERLLTAVAVQQTDGLFNFSCVVVDNDGAARARPIVERLRTNYPVPIRYAVETERNFASVRNRALSLVSGKFAAFIDDDEVPCGNWLVQLWRVLHHYRADAVFGPVRPYFEREPPSWIKRGRICERPSYATGTTIHWRKTRTGNVLFRMAIVVDDAICFDRAYASGGEDVDFFRRAAKQGRTFVWCEEAPAYELVPEARLRRRYHLKRAFLQGRLSLSYAIDRPSALGALWVATKAFAATVIYTAALPFLFLLGDHLGMKYLIKDCHHIARLLAILGVWRSTRRDF